jgi:hypothetical protein
VGLSLSSVAAASHAVSVGEFVNRALYSGADRVAGLPLGRLLLGADAELQVAEFSWGKAHGAGAFARGGALALQLEVTWPAAVLSAGGAGTSRGLVSARAARPGSRKNGWQLSEHGGESTPWGQQHLLDRSVWDVDGLRDFPRRYVVSGLADDGEGAGPGGCGVLVVDETGFAKRGKTSAGVAHQYSGALGGVFPCQVGGGDSSTP